VPTRYFQQVPFSTWLFVARLEYATVSLFSSL